MTKTQPPNEDDKAPPPTDKPKPKADPPDGGVIKPGTVKKPGEK